MGNAIEGDNRMEKNENERGIDNTGEWVQFQKGAWRDQLGGYHLRSLPVPPCVVLCCVVSAQTKIKIK